MKEEREQIKNHTKNLLPSKPDNVTLDDFNMVKVLGRGAFGKVLLVEKKDTRQMYAMKSIQKDIVIKKSQIENTKTERFILEHVSSIISMIINCSLNQINHPFLVSLDFAFQTPDRLFFVMRYMK